MLFFSRQTVFSVARAAPEVKASLHSPLVVPLAHPRENKTTTIVGFWGKANYILIFVYDKIVVKVRKHNTNLTGIATRNLVSTFEEDLFENEADEENTLRITTESF